MAKKKKAVKRPLIPLKYLEAVERGVEFLDMVVGRKKWLRRMKMRDFDIKDPNTCVAGNVFESAYFDGNSDGYNSFMEAVNAIGGDGDKLAGQFGFQADNDKGYQYLQDLWVMKVKQLKARAR